MWLNKNPHIRRLEEENAILTRSLKIMVSIFEDIMDDVSPERNRYLLEKYGNDLSFVQIVADSIADDIMERY